MRKCRTYSLRVLIIEDTMVACQWIWIFVGVCAISLVESLNCKTKQEPKCRISRTYKMKSADCFNKDFREFPQCLPADIEIVDLSKNRIRKLPKLFLEKYGSLKILFLSDNAIASIDEEAFGGLDSLATLDLSMNSISTVPSVIFHLPSLKSLYLGQNLNMNIAHTLEKTKPITSPLNQLDISSTSEDIEFPLPDLGTLPFLVKYNISGNKFESLSARPFAGLCNLKILDTTNVTGYFYEPCDCWRTNAWLKKRKVEFTDFECDVNLDGCPRLEVSDEDLEIFEECKKMAEVLAKKSYVMISVACVVVGLILLSIAAFFIIRARKRRNNQAGRSHQTFDPPSEKKSFL